MTEKELNQTEYENEDRIAINLRYMDSQMSLIALRNKLSEIVAFTDINTGRILAFNKSSEWPFFPTEMISDVPNPATTKPIVFSLRFDRKEEMYSAITNSNIGNEFSERARNVIEESIKRWNKKQEEFFNYPEDTD